MITLDKLPLKGIPLMNSLKQVFIKLRFFIKQINDNDLEFVNGDTLTVHDSTDLRNLDTFLVLMYKNHPKMNNT